MLATPAEAIARGVDFLLKTQDASGGWRRSRYGALRGGVALTAFVLRTLSQLMPRDAPAAAPFPAPTASSNPSWATALREPLAAAVDFLRPGLEKRGAIACPDGTLDLPVYATALALLAESPTRPLWSADERQRLRGYLLATQVFPGRGFARTDPHVGGWDLGGDPPPRGITTGTNISLTAWAVQALAMPPTDSPSEVRDNADANSKAAIPDANGDWVVLAHQWLERSQNRPGDGGFMFTPDHAMTDNKAGLDPETRQPRSYGSASCDGLLALAALRSLAAVPSRDTSPSEPAWTAVLDWFGKLENWDRPPGGPNSLWFYWAARLVAASAHFPQTRREAAHETIVAAVIERQRADGSWTNPEPGMREDDPLIATPLAIAALSGLN
ncbi:MAG: prenyltransferase/squalene oxidase repeat-containing protein [Planctomycetota bacterium]